MAWEILTVSLAMSDTSMVSEGGRVTATVKVSGRTDDAGVSNQFTASVRDDHFIPDILGDSGPQTVEPGETIQQSFEVELWCNKRRKVVGPAGSSHERTAEVYAYVAGEEREGQSDNIPISCI